MRKGKVPHERSLSSDLSEPSKLVGRERDLSEAPELRLFSDAHHQKMVDTPHPQFDTGTQSSPLTQTYTNKIFVYFRHLSRGSRAIRFWREWDSSVDTREEMLRVIREQFLPLSGTDIFVGMIDTTYESVTKVLGQMKRRAKAARVMFHYIGSSLFAPYEQKNSELLYFLRDSGGIGGMNMTSFCDLAGDHVTYVFDRDRSGALLPSIVEWVEQTKLTDHPATDFVAFFSCGANEVMPRSTSLPLDFFSACLTSPARVALIWHSRRYCNFPSGPLQPLSLFFVEEMSASPEGSEKVSSLLRDLEDVLIASVEAIAYKILDKSLFRLFFRSDKVLEKLSVSFILATRILRAFDVTPLSYPSLPPMSNSKDWQVFDLRLDATLCILQNKGTSIPRTLSIETFLENALQSVITRVTVSEDDSFPFELSLFPVILRRPSLYEKACDALSIYLDLSCENVVNALYFPICPALFQILTKGNPCKSLFFCLIKLLSYDIEVRKSIFEQFQKVHLIKVLGGCIADKEYYKLILILLTILLKDSPKYFSLLFPKQDHIEFALQHRANLDEKIWTLLFLSCCVHSLDQNMSDRVIAFLLEMLRKDENSIEVRMGIVHVFLNFIRQTAENSFSPLLSRNATASTIMEHKRIEKKVVSMSLDLRNSTSEVVRREILVLVSRFVANYRETVQNGVKELAQRVNEFLSQYQNDPCESIASMASDIHDSLYIGDAVAQTSHFADFYVATFHKPVRQLLTEPNTKLSDIIRPDLRPSVTKYKMLKSVSSSGNQLRKIRPSKIYRHKCGQITSNLHNLVTDNIVDMVFGDSTGMVHVKRWNDESHMKHSPFATGSRVTGIAHLKNNGSGLVISACENSNCYVFHETDMSKATSFSLSTCPGTVRLACDQWNYCLYSFARDEGDVFSVRDLARDKELRSMRPKTGKTVAIRCIERYHDYVAVCGDTFELYDLRASYVEPMIEVSELPARAFDMEIIDPTVPTFAVATHDSYVSFLDTRHPEGIRSYVNYFRSDDSATDTISFAMSARSSACALCHSEGIVFIDLLNGNREVLPQLQPAYSNIRCPRAQAMIFHEYDFTFAFVNDCQNIVTCSPWPD